jgi:hypothetical protein
MTFFGLALLQRPARATDLDGFVRAITEGRCRCLLTLTEVDGLRLFSGIREGGELGSFVRSIAERLIVRFPTSAPIIRFTYLQRRGGRKLMGNLSFHNASFHDHSLNIFQTIKELRYNYRGEQ